MVTGTIQPQKQGNPQRVPFCRWALGLLAALCFLGGCAPEKQVVTINSSLNVEGGLNFGEGTSVLATTASGFYIDGEGRRRQIPGFQLNEEGTFNFALDLSTMIVKERWQTPPEQLAAMGNPAPEDITKKSQLGRSLVGFLRLELFPDTLTGNVGTVPYFKAHLPIERTKTFTPGGAAELGDAVAVATSEVGYVKVQVVDSEDRPIPTATVTVVPLKDLDTIIGQGSPLLPWDSSFYGSVAAQTNANGEGYALPIPSTFAVSRFQIAVAAENYCLAISEQSGFDVVQLADQPLKIVLQSCSETEKPEFDFNVDFDPAINQFPLDSNPELTAGHTNLNFVNLTLQATGKSFRGMKARVFNQADVKDVTDFDTVAAAPAVEIDFPTFSENYEVDIDPLVTGVTSARFVVVVTPLGEPAVPSKILHGIYANSTLPTSSSFYTVAATTGQANTIPLGQPGFQVALVNRNRCKTGEELGVYFGITPVLASDITFKPCDSGSLMFSTSEIPSASSLKDSGNRTMTFVRRDRFGNISPRPTDPSGNPTGDDEVEVYVDATVPSLEPIDNIDTITYNVDFGIAPSDVDLSNPPYLFLPNAVTVTPATLSSFALVFASPESCELDEDDKTGDAHKVFDYRLVTAASAEDATFSGAQRCDGTTRFPLTTDILTFPDDPNFGIVIQLQVRDFAGQISAPKTYTIPGCAAVSSGTCWQPD